MGGIDDAACCAGHRLECVFVRRCLVIGMSGSREINFGKNRLIATGLAPKVTVLSIRPKLRGRARTPDSAGGGPRARGGWRKVFSEVFFAVICDAKNSANNAYKNPENRMKCAAKNVSQNNAKNCSSELFCALLICQGKMPPKNPSQPPRTSELGAGPVKPCYNTP